MKIVDDTTTINVDQLDLTVHVIVGKIQGKSVIFSYSSTCPNNSRFMSLANIGDNWPSGDADPINFIRTVAKQHQLHAFSNYRDALRWLLEN